MFHANVFMAQCGGIGVGELNKLEVDLCERLNWRLLPPTADIKELIEALPNPQANFWEVWYNARAVRPASPAEAADAPALAPRLPHAKSVADSLGRFFRSGGAVSAAGGGASDGNLHALGEQAAQQSATQMADCAGAAASQQQTPRTEHAKALRAAGAADDTSDEGSPRSVVQRTFSLSNLFGLASW